MPVQNFLLDSTNPGYAGALTDLATGDAANYSFIPTQTTRDAVHDSSLKIVKANVTNAQRNAIFGSSYPTDLCRHRWESLESFRISGFHLLNESVRSYFGVSGRAAVFIRPQQGYSRTADNYGAGDGKTHHSALNGPQDPAIDGGASTTFQTGTDYFLSEGPMTRWDDGSNPGSSPGTANNGLLPMEDATGLGEAGKIRIASDPDCPGFWWGSYRGWDRFTDLPFEAYDEANNIHVCGGGQIPQFGNNWFAGGSFLELDIEDQTLDVETLLMRHALHGHSAIADLNGAGGRGRLAVLPGTITLNPSSVQVWNTSTFSDVTSAMTPAPAEATVLALNAPDDSAVYFGFPYKYAYIGIANTVSQVGGTGVWEYYNGSTWSTPPNLSDSTGSLTSSGTVSCAPASDWAKTAVSTATEYFYIRWRKTGGTVTTACVMNAVSRPDEEPVIAVKTFDGTATYTDVTTAAVTLASDDFEMLPIGAANNAGVYWCLPEIGSRLRINLSQVQIGGTGIWEYKTSVGWNTFTNIIYPTSGFTSGTGTQHIDVNPKIDWASDTIDSVTGFWIRWRKTGGTVTQAARGDDAGGFAKRMFFVHRWNDGAPTNGVCYSSLKGGNAARYRLLCDGKGNIEFHRFRQIGGSPVASNNLTSVEFVGSQVALSNSFQTGGATTSWTMKAATHGKRWWSIADHLHYDKTDPFIANLIAQVLYALDNMNNASVDSVTGNTIGEDITADLAEAGITTPDLTAWDDMGDWNDFTFCGSGLYGTNGLLTLIHDGHKNRRCVGILDGLNDSEIIRVESNDNHILANYGAYNAETLGSRFDRIGIEHGNRMCDFYPQADGNNDKPVGGAGSTRRYMRFRYCYFSTWSGDDDGRAPGGIMFESDSDAGLYDNGGGAQDLNSVTFCGFKDLPNQNDDATAILNTTPDCTPKVRFCEYDNAGTFLHLAGGFSNNGPRSTNAITEASGPNYNDITDNLKDSGNTATDLFDTGATGDILNLGVSTGFVRTFTFNITTVGVGAPTLVWEYRKNDASWATVASLSDGTSGFTSTGTVTFNRPTDAATIDINGKMIWAVRVRIAAGSFSTVPQANEISTIAEAGGINAKHNAIRNCPGAVNDGIVVNMFMGVGTALTNSGVIIEDHNRIYLSGGQDSATQFFRINGVNNYTLAQWQTFVKLAVNTDAPVDSVFGPNTVLV